MKHFIFIAFAVIASQSYSQQYHSMVDTNATWYTEQGVAGFNDGFYRSGARYILSGDTLLQSSLHYKLWWQPLYNFHYSSQGIWTGGYDNNTWSVLVGGLREDSARKVWFYCFEQIYFYGGILEPDSIYLLYDFSLSVGDTFRWDNWGNGIELPLIDSIQLLNGEWRKRFYFYGDPWIEGIGSTNSIFGPRVLCSIDCFFDLKCYVHSDSLLFKKFPSVACDSINANPNVGLNETNLLTYLEFYPNPVSDLINVNYKSHSSDRAKLQFTDMLGRKLYQTEIRSGESLQLPTTLFNNNHFVFCQLQEGNYSITKKILIE